MGGAWAAVLLITGVTTLVAFIDDRIKLRRALAAVRRFRAILLQRIEYRAATPDDRSFLERLPAQRDEQLKQRLILLGDTIGAIEDLTFFFRVFVDETRTSIVSIEVGPRYSSVCAESYGVQEELRTTTAARAPYVQPPYRRVQSLNADASLDELLTAHREFLQTTDSSQLSRPETLADVIRIWMQAREREVAWRETHAPDELLEKDLRMVLGPAFSRVGPRWMRRMRAAVQIPQARVHVPPKT